MECKNSVVLMQVLLDACLNLVTKISRLQSGKCNVGERSYVFKKMKKLKDDKILVEKGLEKFPDLSKFRIVTQKFILQGKGFLDQYLLSAYFNIGFIIYLSQLVPQNFSSFKYLIEDRFTINDYLIMNRKRLESRLLDYITRNKLPTLRKLLIVTKYISYDEFLLRFDFFLSHFGYELKKKDVNMIEMIKLLVSIDHNTLSLKLFDLRDVDMSIKEKLESVLIGYSNIISNYMGCFHEEPEYAYVF